MPRRVQAPPTRGSATLASDPGFRATPLLRFRVRRQGFGLARSLLQGGHMMLSRSSRTWRPRLGVLDGHSLELVSGGMTVSQCTMQLADEIKEAHEKNN